MSGPKGTDVTLYIPVRNCARTLPAAIAGAAAQAAAPAEIMLVADARSDDDTLRIARASGLRVIEQREGRLGYARNLALTHCRTPWLASCDADVTLEPDWLTRLMERAEPHIAALSGCTLERLFTDADRWRAVNMPHNWGPLPLDNPFMLISEMLARVDALRAVGGYLPDLAYGEDSDLCQRLRHAGFALRYEPGAVAHHDRRDSVESVLDLRWVYSFHRQRPRFESLPGLVEKLGINRTYCVQSLSQTLHSPHADTLALSVMLWFHHARRDLLAALARWPLVTAEARNTCVAELWGALDAALVGPWSPLRAPLLSCLPDVAAHNTQDGGLAATPGFRAYLASAAQATRDFLAEIPDELVPAILNSAVRMAGTRGSGGGSPATSAASPAAGVEMERAPRDAPQAELRGQRRCSRIDRRTHVTRRGACGRRGSRRGNRRSGAAPGGRHRARGAVSGGAGAARVGGHRVSEPGGAGGRGPDPDAARSGLHLRRRRRGNPTLLHRGGPDAARGPPHVRLAASSSPSADRARNPMLRRPPVP
jgi:glycosyltransferase involved in cell wall biosynthesis